MLPRPAALALGMLLLAGCLGHSTPHPTATSDGPERGIDDEPGIDQDQGNQTADNGPAPGQARHSILQQAFTIDSTQPGSSFPVTVPANATHVWLTMDYTFGAFQDAGFDLGACRHVSTVTGTATYTPNGEGHFNGQSTPGQLFDCGAMPPGPASITWSLTGHAEGQLMAYADTPAPKA